jgi:hypothetical protein
MSDQRSQSQTRGATQISHRPNGHPQIGGAHLEPHNSIH